MRCVLVLLVAMALRASTAHAMHNPWVRVPGGSLIHESCLRPVENMELISGPLKPCPFRAKLTIPEDQIYNMDVHYVSSSDLMATMNASWTVPTVPSTNDDQVVYFWPGFKSDSPTMGLPVLQPVLQFGADCCGGGAYWIVRSWFVYGNAGIAIYSPELAVNAGDVIDSGMNYDSWAQVWTITARNSVSGADSTLLVARNSTDNTDFHVAMLTLETIMDQSVCSDYPQSGSITFTGININGKTPQWTDRVQDTQCGEAIKDSSTTVTFSWNSSKKPVITDV